MSVKRPALAWVCVASLVVLALALGLATGVDEDGNLHMYTSDPVVLLAFCALGISALWALGVIGRPSASAVGSSLIWMLTILVYWLALLAAHPDEFEAESPLAWIVLTTVDIASLVSVAALLGGLVGAGASGAVLGGRWLHDHVRPRHGAHL